MPRPLSTSEVARILGMRDAQVRALVRSGLCHPAQRGRGYAFSFPELVVLRAAKELMERQVPAARVRRALAALRAQLPEDRPLSGLRIFADGRHVAVRDPAGAWQPETGQALLDFPVDDLADGVARLPEVRAPETPAPPTPGDGRARAFALFHEALALEGSDAGAAADAYRRAVALDPSLTDAWVNLGRLAHEGGDPRRAARLYHRALERDPEDPVVHFNLGLALEDAEGPAAAAAHYQRAISLDPDFADAHYNLAGVCEELGRAADALRHYHAYKKLTEG